MSFMCSHVLKQTEYVVRCAIWYHLYNSKNVKNTHEGVLKIFKIVQMVANRATHHIYV